MTGPYWFRHEPAFCTTGALFAQPVRAGQLRDEWSHSDCGFLDAPEYICTGSIAAELTDAGRFATERADASRDRMASDWDWAQRATEPTWGDEHYWCDADLHDMQDQDHAEAVAV